MAQLAHLDDALDTAHLGALQPAPTGAAIASADQQDIELAHRVAASRLLDQESLRRLLLEAQEHRRCGRNVNLAGLLSSRRLVDVRRLSEAPTVAESQEPTLRPGALAPRALNPGDRVGGTTVVRELGRGAMGAVYLAREPSGEEVAVKLMLSLSSGTALERFRREAEALRRLRHPGVVRLVRADLDARPPCLVMEYVRGKELRELVTLGTFDLEERLDLLEQVCRAVHSAHQLGIVHRDLKPANILVAAGGVAKVTDFGLVRDLGRETRITASGAAVGTPAYMAPEQLRGSDTIGPHTDVYTLGTILYELLGGQLPFKADSAISLARAIVLDEPVPPSRLANAILGVGAEHDRVCANAMAKKGAERTPSALKLAEQIARLRHDGSRPAPPSSTAYRTLAVAAVLLIACLASAVGFLAGRRPESAANSRVPSSEDVPPPATDPAPPLLSDSEPALTPPTLPTEDAPEQSVLPMPEERGLAPLLADTRAALGALDPKRALAAIEQVVARYEAERQAIPADVQFAELQALDLSGQFERAYTSVKALIDDGTFEHHYGARLLAAQLANFLSKAPSGEQLEHLTAAISIDPARHEALTRRGLLLLLSGQRDRGTCREDLQFAVEQAPQSPEALRNLALLRMEDALSQPTNRERLIGELEVLVARALAANPEFSSGYALRGWAQGQRRKTKEQSESRLRALKLRRDERSLGGHFTRRAEELHPRFELGDLGVLTELARVAQRARAEDPLNTIAGAYFGFTLLEGATYNPAGKGLLDQSVKALKAACNFNPASWRAQAWFGEAWAARPTSPQRELGVKYLDGALLIAPNQNRHEVLIARSSARFALGQLEGALSDANEARGLRGTWFRPHICRARALKGLGQEQEAAKARADAARILKSAQGTR
jgi:serine/threonine protein kinase